ncbi:hypothetical protein VFPPC_18694 [Pochonia chlamydosporia 170]|uniref:Uncharacterized protein n=1 Tax=Pochonia chlamydosporia 170 TaxID=1380566 RepID=A0A219ASL8_METCM|nr:hypothetical protein VFPPC_18694 [Pochonia chlamydosporia 170]OWT43579.1 hypothetical protein VFPPC_18694 [Pochonia chlamydosporia 170]
MNLFSTQHSAPDQLTHAPDKCTRPPCPCCNKFSHITSRNRNPPCHNGNIGQASRLSTLCKESRTPATAPSLQASSFHQRAQCVEQSTLCCPGCPVEDASSRFLTLGPFSRT